METNAKRRLQDLRERHVPALPSRQACVLAGLAAGLAPEEIALALGLNPKTVERHLQEAMGKILDGAFLPHRRETLVAWFWVHSDGCTRPLLEMLQRGTWPGDLNR